MTSCRRPHNLVVVVLLGFLAVGVVSRAQDLGVEPRSDGTAADPVPMMAYYYIWFDTSSWSRAKRDFPTLGRYSSDDAAVMEQHVRWAADAGIRGFIVSWKWTDRLDRRLEQLATIADAHGMKLWIIYQGLDFERNPVPVQQVDMDLQHLVEAFGHHPSLDAGSGKPLVIWSGTWKFSTDDVRSTAASLRPRMLLLASERSVEGYQRLAGAVDGDAYYLASADPVAAPSGVARRLDQLGSAVHADHGLWIAPAAPGFDATLLGGTTVVPRRGGATLQQSLGLALASSPDAIGLISWNEFSENTHVEPSVGLGHAALNALTARSVTPLPAALDFDSSAPGTTEVDRWGRMLRIGLVTTVLALVFALSVWRSAPRLSSSPAAAHVPGRRGQS